MIPILNMSDASALKARVMNRSQLQNEEVSRRVKEIVARVREEGDAALFEYTARFDKANINADNVLVSREEIESGATYLSLMWQNTEALKEALN